MEEETLSTKSVFQLIVHFEEAPGRLTDEESGTVADTQKVQRSPEVKPVSKNPKPLILLKTPLPPRLPLQSHNMKDTRGGKKKVSGEGMEGRDVSSDDSEIEENVLACLGLGSKFNEAHSVEEPSPQERRLPQRLSMKYLRSFQVQLVDSKWRLLAPNLNAGGHGSQDPEEKKIACELLETEQAYVHRLHLLDQVYYSELMAEAQSKKTFPEDVVRLIFSNISCICQFHGLFFLPELKQRMAEWDSKPRIGDIIQKLAPFLKMYAEYVRNFDNAMQLICLWMEKCPRFQEIIEDIQRREVSANLSLRHHMLEPVQRVPRYELLMKEYLKKLPPQSQDRPDTEKALELIFSAAKHSNAAIAEMERLRRLWEVYKRLGVEEDFVDPSNELIKEGAIQKISLRRSSSTTERYLFLVGEVVREEVCARADMAQCKWQEVNT